MLDQLFGLIRNNVDDLLNFSPSTTKGSFLGHSIEVSLDEKKLSLYIDGALAETSGTYWWPRKDAILLRGVVSEGSIRHEVHVYGQSGILKTKIKICVDEQHIAGEQF